MQAEGRREKERQRGDEREKPTPHSVGLGWWPRRRATSRRRSSRQDWHPSPRRGTAAFLPSASREERPSMSPLHPPSRCFPTPCPAPFPGPWIDPTSVRKLAEYDRYDGVYSRSVKMCVRKVASCTDQGGYGRDACESNACARARARTSTSDRARVSRSVSTEKKREGGESCRGNEKRKLTVYPLK